MSQSCRSTLAGEGAASARLRIRMQTHMVSRLQFHYYVSAHHIITCTGGRFR